VDETQIALLLSQFPELDMAQAAPPPPLLDRVSGPRGGGEGGVGAMLNSGTAGFAMPPLPICLYMDI
jgi:hypothetical protein